MFHVNSVVSNTVELLQNLVSTILPSVLCTVLCCLLLFVPFLFLLHRLMFVMQRMNLCDCTCADVYVTLIIAHGDIRF